jgi:hypothetical protein
MNRGRYDEQISEPVSVLAGVTILASIGPMHTASACGDSEAPSCGSSGTPEEARWMLNRAVREVKADQSGENGSRTMDLYVFCIGPDNKIDAHPNPSLMGQDAPGLRDQKGKPFGAEMLDSAREGSISEIRYLFPKLGSSVPQPKTSFVTRVADQVCGVGYYD